jgi:hypothetical protein
MTKGILLTFLLSALLPALSWAESQGDEPGVTTDGEQPFPKVKQSLSAPSPEDLPAFRLELGFGYASLLVDPDVQEGLGGGMYLAYGLHKRFGVELTAFFSKNAFEDLLGSIGTSFLAGNITLGPIFQVTPPGSRVSVTLDLGMGTYLVVPIFQESVWTLGFSGGATFALHVTDWFGVGLKCRYHLFNLATISGPELFDLKAFMKIGVIDRLEIPGYLAFYF